MNKEKEILNLIFELVDYGYILSEKYFNLLSNIIEEPSNGFGIKPLSEFENRFVDNIDKALNSEIFSYYIYDKFYKHENDLEKKRLLKEECIKEIKSLNIKELEKKILFLIIDTVETLYKNDLIYEKVIQEFLIEKSQSFGFKPIDDLIKYIEEKLDKEIYRDYNEIFYWFFFENNFGEKNLNCSKDIFHIDGKESLWKYFESLDKVKV